MIKKISLFIAMTMMLALAACNAAPAAQAANGTGSNQTAAGTPQPGQGQVNTETKLMIGTLKLEGTDQAVTKEQAAQLLPLWKALKTLTASETSSQEEINALYKQIEGTMTADQMKTIDAMQISFQSMGEVMQKLGITPEAGNFGGFSGTPDPARQATREARIAQGGGTFSFSGGGPGGRDGPPAGGTGGGPGFAPGGEPGFFQGNSAGQSGTPAPGRGTGRGRSNPLLLNALITLLQERAG